MLRTDRFRGYLLGLAAGDALGTLIETYADRLAGRGHD